ncbi:MAG: hypothetical protein QF893_19515 [Alphaproteobacteria bacterium]|nr:hypothetical protein [Alphaproteobacteria bacterium]
MAVPIPFSTMPMKDLADSEDSPVTPSGDGLIFAPDDKLVPPRKEPPPGSYYYDGMGKRRPYHRGPSEPAIPPGSVSSEPAAARGQTKPRRNDAREGSGYTDADHLFGCWYEVTDRYSGDRSKPIKITANGPLVSAELVWRKRIFEGVAEGGRLTLDYTIKGVADLSDGEWWESRTAPPEKVIQQVLPRFRTARYVFTLGQDHLDGAFKAARLRWGKESLELTVFEPFDRPWVWVRDHGVKVTSVKFMDAGYSKPVATIGPDQPLHVEVRASVGCPYVPDLLQIEMWSDADAESKVLFTLVETGPDTKVFRAPMSGLVLPPAPGASAKPVKAFYVSHPKSLRGDAVEVSKAVPPARATGTVERKEAREKKPPLTVKSLAFSDASGRTVDAYPVTDGDYGEVALAATATGGDPAKPDRIEAVVRVNNARGETETNIGVTLIETGPDTGRFKSLKPAPVPPPPGGLQDYDHAIAEDADRTVVARARFRRAGEGRSPTVSQAGPSSKPGATACADRPIEVSHIEFVGVADGAQLFATTPRTPFSLRVHASGGCTDRPDRFVVYLHNHYGEGNNGPAHEIELLETANDSGLYRPAGGQALRVPADAGRGKPATIEAISADGGFANLVLRRPIAVAREGGKPQAAKPQTDTRSANRALSPNSGPLGPIVEGWPLEKLRAEQKRMAGIAEKLEKQQSVRVYRMTYELEDGRTFDRLELDELPELEHPAVTSVTPQTFLQRGKLVDALWRASNRLATLIEQRKAEAN